MTRLPCVLVSQFALRPPGELPRIVGVAGRLVQSGTVTDFSCEQLVRHLAGHPSDLLVAWDVTRLVGGLWRVGGGVVWRRLRIIDLRLEYRRLTNGLDTPVSLMHAFLRHGIPRPELGHDGCIDAPDETDDEQRQRLTRAAINQLEPLGALFERLRPTSSVEWDQALARGRYAVATALMEDVGIPIDIAVWKALAAAEHDRDESWCGRLAIGGDDRNRVPLNVYGTVTGRFAPSSNRYVLGLPRWMRGLIQPEPGMGLALLDWHAQEFAIAAALSRDANMIDAYRAGDPYQQLADRARALRLRLPGGVDLRTAFKRACLILQNAGTANTLIKEGFERLTAKAIVELHRKTFKTFRTWRPKMEREAREAQRMTTAFGWQRFLRKKERRASLSNFPIQSTGAEILRTACVLLQDQGIRVCGPLHDAVLVEAPVDVLDDVVRDSKGLMQQAAARWLDGLELRVDAHVIRHPERLVSEQDQERWARQAGGICAGLQRVPCRTATPDRSSK